VFRLPAIGSDSAAAAPDFDASSSEQATTGCEMKKRGKWLTFAQLRNLGCACGLVLQVVDEQRVAMKLRECF
jgi:hypothetical protein